MVLAAVLSEIGRPLEVAELELREPVAGQVRVRIAATGVCHSDRSLARGVLPQQVPVVLGHEAAGTVVAVGDGVTSTAPGKRVVICWAPPCGQRWFCQHGEPWLCEHSSDAAGVPYGTVHGEPVYPGLSTAGFAEETVVAAGAVIPVPEAVPLEQAALVGCAVMTGVGAVLNTAKVRQGESVLVVGLGGVGLSVVQGARLAGAAQIIAVDRSAERLALAQMMGATDAVEAGAAMVKQVRVLTGGRGTDHAFDCVGLAETIRGSWSATRRGGHTTVVGVGVGVGGKDQQVSFSALELFYFARTIAGCVYGSTDATTDIPRMLSFAAEGRLDLAALVTDRVSLDGIEGAFAAMERGAGGRVVVVP